LLQVVYLVGGFFLSEFGLARNIGWEPPPPAVKIRQNSSFFSQLTEVCHAKITQQDHEKNRQIRGLSISSLFEVSEKRGGFTLL